MSAAPAKRKPAAKTAKKTATKAPAKAAPKAAKKAAAPRAAARTAPKATAPDRPSAPPAASAAPAAAAAATSGPIEVCPRCGTATFGPEDRTRWEGRRTVRFTVLVCERGHTFAHPVVKPA